MNKSITITLFSVFISLTYLFGQTPEELRNRRSDTIDVKNYTITMDFTKMTQQKITASCQVTFENKMNEIDGISLDLLRLTIDSIKMRDDLLSYSYNDTLLRVQFPTSLNQGETDSITVYYNGTPQTDASTFGGFYFSGVYAYSIGVGFNADPHNYGRVWHPCFDNFVERATYDITLISPSNNVGYSNGTLVFEETGENNTNIRHWKLEEEIPSYLACVAVAPYTHVSDEYISNLTGDQIPVVLAALATDTVKLKSSFIHLQDAFHIYEDKFGPYRWDKVGYVIVPFNAGAMEHASLISYPKATVNGTTAYETTMAHELSHHWWGNLVTCETSGDMWINEGISSYCEEIFIEEMRGYSDYIKSIKAKHRSVIQRAHYDDGGFLALSDMPHDATYGTHTYSKGATMMHNLRTYMGETEFYEGLRAITEDFAFQSVNAEEFRNKLTESTNFNATPFFKDYIFNPGFNGFEIDSFVVNETGSGYTVTTYIQQKLFEAPEYFSDVPMQITFMNNAWESYSETILLSGENNAFEIQLPFYPTMVYLNKDFGLLNAVTGEDMVVTNPSIYASNYAYTDLTVSQNTDSSFVRVEHYRLSPDDFHNPDDFILSTDRYWKIDGIWSDDFTATAKFNYDGRNSVSGNLDIGLMQDHGDMVFTEDSLILLWRPNASSPWKEYDDYTISTGANKTDKTGRIDAKEIKKGEYTFGLRLRTLDNREEELQENKVKIYPNPAKESLFVKYLTKSSKGAYSIYDTKGNLIEKSAVTNHSFSIDIQQLPIGVYHISFSEDGQIVSTQKFIKQ